MLRSKGLADKMILLGIDGMDPRFTRKLVDEGKMPNVKKLMDMGACRDDLVLLGGVPTITPPMWATLATGAYPMTHGIIDFQLSFPVNWISTMQGSIPHLAKPNNYGMLPLKPAKKHWFGIGLVLLGHQAATAKI